MSASNVPRGIHRLAVGTSVATFLLLIAGGLVTSTKSGLSVPDWPLSFGTVFPEMKGGVLFEHGHRMIAGCVSVLIFALGFWIWRREQRSSVRWLALAAALGVIAQAVLGGVTVLLRLPPEISVAHASLAQGVFCLTLALAVLTSPAWLTTSVSPEDGDPRPLKMAGLITFSLLYLQLVLGAILRHTGSVLIWHISGAVAASLSVLHTASVIMRRHGQQRPLARAGQRLVVLLVIQVSLGIYSLLAGRPVVLTTAHLAVGALLLGTALTATLWAAKLSGERQVAPSPPMPIAAEARS